MLNLQGMFSWYMCKQGKVCMQLSLLEDPWPWFMFWLWLWGVWIGRLVQDAEGESYHMQSLSLFCKTCKWLWQPHSAGLYPSFAISLIVPNIPFLIMTGFSSPSHRHAWKLAALHSLGWLELLQSFGCFVMTQVRLLFLPCKNFGCAFLDCYGFTIEHGYLGWGLMVCEASLVTKWVTSLDHLLLHILGDNLSLSLWLCSTQHFWITRIVHGM